MTKQEKIQEAYGKHWETVKDIVDENGWCSKRKRINFEVMKKDFDIAYDAYDSYTFRPKSLQGIENNHKWIKLESREDLPKETGQYLTHRANGIIITEWFYNNNLSWYLWKDCYSITHYQPIIKPREPVY